MNQTLMERVRRSISIGNGAAAAVEDAPIERRNNALEEMKAMVERGELAQVTFNPFRNEVVARRHDVMNFAFDPLVATDPAARDAILAKLANETPPRHVPDKPSADMLRKMETPELVEGDGRQALAVEVEDLLGYTPLRKETGAPSRLQRILAELEIVAFDPATVREYKDRMQAHFEAKLDVRRPATPRLVGGMIEIATLREFFDFAGQQVRSVEWRDTPLRGYSKPVPEFVLRKCVQIKERAPDAEFFVDELREEQRTLDPFLVVKLGQEHAFIEVWDEPEFEKAL